MDISFRRIDRISPGTLFRLLYASYAGWSQREQYVQRWRAADHDYFTHIDTMGDCVLVTFVADEPVGFITWDPCQFPLALIGHNCILPAMRGRGLGQLQLCNALDTLRDLGFESASVTTGCDAFFDPARRMYEAAGMILSADRTQEQASYYCHL